jgi:hypothetical protein
MGMPASRPNLDVEVRQELLDRFLRDYERDRSEGKTVRVLHETLERHIEIDDERFGGMMRELSATAQRVSHQEGVTDTGRFIVPPPSAFQSPIQVNVGTSSKPSKRPSMIAPLLEGAKKPLVIVLTALLTVLAHAIIRLLK